MLIIKDYNWSQNEDEIVIEIPMKNRCSNTDILTSEKFVKVHAAPYYLELFLLHSVVDEESRCQLTKNGARLCLKKCENIEWESLERQFESKEEKVELKQKILHEIQMKSNEKSKMRVELKEKIKRDGIENAMAKDAENRECIEKVKRSLIEMEVSKVDEIKQKQVEDEMKSICDRKCGTKKTQQQPEIRKSAHIEIEFSKRNFVTPKRESQTSAEQEWIMKQSEARRSTVGFVEEDLLPEERNPMYLKSKGDDFFRKNNYLAAISAYSTGIKLAGKCYELYLNRSAAHYALGNYQRCAEDCTKSLELLHPPVEMNRKARKQAFVRRAAALTKLGFHNEALGEFEAAIALDPSDETLKDDANLLKSKIAELNDE